MEQNEREEEMMMYEPIPTLEEIFEKPIEYWESKRATDTIGKWGDIAMEMFEAQRTPLYMELKAVGKHYVYLHYLNEEMSELNMSLRERMNPKPTHDWYTDWQNLEKMSMRIEEIIIYEYIEPLVLAK